MIYQRCFTCDAEIILNAEHHYEWLHRFGHSHDHPAIPNPHLTTEQKGWVAAMQCRVDEIKATNAAAPPPPF